MQRVLIKGLMATQAMWEPLRQVYGWVYQLAQVLDDAQVESVEERQLRFAMLLLSIQERAAHLDPAWQHAVAHLLKVTASYGPHLFFCYQIPNELAPSDVQAWREVRARISYRQEGRRKQWRFRKDPSAYLAALEAQLLKMSLRT